MTLKMSKNKNKIKITEVEKIDLAVLLFLYVSLQ